MVELDSRWLFCAVIVAVAAQRLLELRVSARHERRLRARGAIEAGAGHYPWMVALHTGLLIAAPVEVWLLGRPLVASLTLVSAAAMVGATGLRYWTIRTLGERWTTRVLYLPGSEPVGGGPFRLLRHPNYLAVLAETLALPLLHTAWLTAAVFGVLNALLLRRRIRVEEGVLRRHTRYAEVFGPPHGGGRAGLTRQRILEELERIAAGKLERSGEISEATRLIEDLRLDSLALLTLAIEVENRFRLRLDDEGVAGIETVGELVDVIEAAQSSDEKGRLEG